jgi:hypothetical protein
MTSDAVRLLVQLAQAEQDAGRPIPESIAAQLLALVASMYECTPAARKRRHRVTSASRERDISVPQAAALGRGVGGMGVVVVEEAVPRENSNSAVQKEPSLDDLLVQEEKPSMVVYQTNRGQLPVAAQALRESVMKRVEGVRRGNARRERYEGLADAVFIYWQGTYEKPASVRMDARRRSVIVRSLTENEGDLSELFYALDGARKSDFHMGRGKYAGGKKYDTPEAILTDRSRIEGHAEMMGDYARGVPHPQAEKFLALTDPQPQLQGVA